MKAAAVIATVITGVFGAILETRDYKDVRNEPFTKFQLLNTHNSYHIRPDPYLPEAYVTWPSLSDQLDNGVRGFEFDLQRTPDADTFLIYHTEIYDEGSTVGTLQEALTELKDWIEDNHSAAYRGEPCIFGFEPKYEDDWTPQDYLNLNKLINDTLGSDNIFGPKDLGAEKGFNTSQVWRKWSDVMISEAEYKFIIRSPARNLDDYFIAETVDPAELNFFYSCRYGDFGDYWCSMYNINNAHPDKNFNKAQTRAADYLVKCNADSRYVQIPGVSFAAGMATADGMTQPTEDWAAMLMFDVVDRNGNDIVSWNETYDFVYHYSENHPDRIQFAEENVKPLCPIHASNYTELVDLYIDLFDPVNTDYNYTVEQGQGALDAGCQIVQTSYLIENIGAEDDYVFNLGCGELSHVEYRYNDGGNVYCIVFEVLDTTDSPDDDDSTDAALTTHAVVSLFVSVLVAAKLM